MANYFERISQSGAVTSLYCNDPPADWEAWTLVISDSHFDSIYCNRTLLRTHLDEAKDRNADVLILGDHFDAMQGRFDPRRSMTNLRPEYRRDDYYDFVVEDSADFLEDYSGNIRIIAKGNHESAVLKNANVDLTNRLVFLMNMRHKTQIQVGGYGGWIRWMFNLSANTEGPRTSLRAKYFHGAGGEAPVTRGVIQTNRQAVYLPDANIVINGHNHHAYYIPIARERITDRGTIWYDIQHHIRVPGYKMDYADGSGGWSVEKGQVPKPIGSFWLKMTYAKQDHRHRVVVRPEPAIESPEEMLPVIEGGDDFEPYLEDTEYP